MALLLTAVLPVADRIAWTSAQLVACFGAADVASTLGYLRIGRPLMYLSYVVAAVYVPGILHLSRAGWIVAASVGIAVLTASLRRLAEYHT